MATDKHHGISRHRLTDNPEEQRFADAWQEQNDTGRTLDWLLDPLHSARTGYPPHAEDREREVAATVVQWLGSSVGQGFLRDLGYVWRAGAGKVAAEKPVASAKPPQLYAVKWRDRTDPRRWLERNSANDATWSCFPTEAMVFPSKQAARAVTREWSNPNLLMVVKHPVTKEAKR